MNKTITGVLTFVAGSAIGAAVTGVLLKKKYEKIAEEEIAEMREYYANELEEAKSSIAEANEQEQAAYDQYVKECGYLGGKAVAANNEEKGVLTTKGPYVIDPEHLGDDDYEIECLTWYADGVLADDMNNVVEDVEGTVGADYFTHFGEYEDEAVHIRNDRLKTDYEILLDVRKYSDVSQL